STSENNVISLVPSPFFWNLKRFWGGLVMDPERIGPLNKLLLAVRPVMALLSLTLLASCAPYIYHPGQTTPPRGQRPYTINGERYEPLASHEGFVEQGIASWYGSDFHGKQTSSGETYD